MRYVRKIIRITFIGNMLLCFVCTLLWPAVVIAYSAAEIDARIPDARNQIVNTENACFNNLVTENSKPGTSRQHVNNSNPYRDITWISPQGSPSQTTVTVPSGTSTVNLQLNKMLFVCAALVDNNITEPSDIDDASSIVTNSNFANDRRPTSTGLSPDTHKASLTGVNTRINSANVVAGGGSVSIAPGSTLPVPRDDNSRYWFTSPVSFTYDAGGPMTSTRTITIALNLTDIRSFGSVNECPSPSGGSPLRVSSNNDFGPCGTVNASYNFTIVVNGGTPIGNLDAANCDKDHFLTGWAFDPDSTATSIQVHVYVGAAAGQPGSIGPGPGALGTGMADKPSDGGTSPPSDVNGAFGISGKHRFDIPFSALNAAQQDALNAPGSHNVYVYGIGVDGSGAIDGVNSPGDGITGSPKAYDPGSCIPPVTFTCSNVTSDPNPIEVGTSFKIKMNISTAGGSTASYPYTANLSMTKPPNPGTLSPASPSAATGTLAKDSSTNIEFSGLSVDAPGNYQGTITVTFTGGATLSCIFKTGGPNGDCMSGCDSLRAVTKPYFQARNGDIAAGVSSLCKGWSSGAATGTLTAWNNGLSSPSNLGAETNLAAYALGLIDGFASANAQGARTPKSLTFANTSGVFGGNLNSGAACPDDYYSTAVSPLPGGSTITGRTIANGVANRIAIYVDGDAYINGNITFTGGATTIDDLPSFYLVVKGNIYIAPNVTQLYGVYVAQPLDDDSKGKIYTCSNGLDMPTIAQLNSGAPGTGCQRTLNVYGAFIAKEFKLYRSNGSMSNGIAAEIFNYTPGTWLVAPCSINRGCGPDRPDDGYDSITSLPPVL